MVTLTITEVMASQLKETRVVLDKLAPESYTFPVPARRSRSHRRRHHKSHQGHNRISEKRRRSSSREKVAKKAKRSKRAILSKKYIDLFGSNTPPPQPEPVCDISVRGAPNSPKKRPLRSRIQFTESSDSDYDDDVQFIESTDATSSNGTEAECTDKRKKPCEYSFEKPCPKSKKKNVIIIGNKKKIEKNNEEDNTAESPPIWNVESPEATKISLEFKNTSDIKSVVDEEIRSTTTQISSKKECSSRAIIESAIDIHKSPIIVKPESDIKSVNVHKTQKIVKSESDIKSEIIEIDDDVESDQYISETTSINNQKLEEFIQKIKNQLYDQESLEKLKNNDIPKLTLKPIESLLSEHSCENKKSKTCQQEALNTSDIETSDMLKVLIESTSEKDREQPPPETHATYCNENAVIPNDPLRSLAEYILFLMKEREKFTKSIEEIEKFTNKDMILKMKTNAQSQLLQNESFIYQQTLMYFQPAQMRYFNKIFIEHLNKVTKDLAAKTRIIDSFNESMYTEVLIKMINKAQEYFKKAMPNEPDGQNSVLPCAESIKETYNKNVVTNFQQVFVNNLGSFKEQLGVQIPASTNSSVSNSSVPIPQYSTPATINQLYSYVNNYKTQESHQSFRSEIGKISINGTPSSSISTALNISNNTYMFPKRAMISQTSNPPPYEQTVHSRISGNNESVYATHPESSVPMRNIQQFQNNLPLDYTRDSVQRQYQSQNNTLYKQLRTPSAPRSEPYQSNSSYQAAAGNQYVKNLPFRPPPVQTRQPSPSYQITNRNYYTAPPPYPYVNESGSKYGINAHTINNNLANVKNPAIQNRIQQRSPNNAYQNPIHGVINPTATIQQCQIPNGSNAIQWGSGALPTWNSGSPNNIYENQRVVSNEYYKASIGMHQSEQDVAYPAYPARVAASRAWSDKSQGRPPSAPVLPEQVRSISRDSGFMSPTAAGMSPVVEQPNTKCKMCEAFTSLKCTQCFNAYYCSVKCQEKDWNLHQFLCANQISYS